MAKKPAAPKAKPAAAKSPMNPGVERRKKKRALRAAKAKALEAAEALPGK